VHRPQPSFVAGSDGSRQPTANELIGAQSPDLSARLGNVFDGSLEIVEYAKNRTLRPVAQLFMERARAVDRATR
jgi:hypothetical protein